MAFYTPPGFREDESFWEVGLHFGLQLIFAFPLAFLTEYLAELAQIKDHLPIMFGMVVGISLGHLVVGWARGKIHLSSRAQSESRARQPLYWVLPIAFPVAVGFDHLLTVLDARDMSMALGIFLGIMFGDALFHAIRSLRARRAGGR